MNIKWGIGGALLLAVGEAMALACPGPSSFDDVAPGDAFCTDVAWLANRGVTLGCGGANFCPSGNVTRGQMALFMQRLGTTLSPVSSTISSIALSLAPLPTGDGPDDADEVLCASTSIPSAAYPRLVVVSGWLSFYVAGGSALVRIYPATSFDGGVNWGRHGPDNYNQQSMEVNTAHSFPIAAHVPLAPGKVLRVGVYPSRAGGTATGLAGGECTLNLLVFSQTGSIAPYDTGLAPVEPRPD